VPFKPYYNRSHGLHTQASGIARGNIRPVWETVYNHYVKRMGVSAPHVEAMVVKVGGARAVAATSTMASLPEATISWVMAP
jgi:hypothetical protein